MCIADGATEVAAAGEASRRPLPFLRALALIPVGIYVIWFILKPLDTYRDGVNRRYARGVSVDLPGAERLRRPPNQVRKLHAVVDGIDRNCTSFLTLPGLNSLYLYTQQRPPVVLNGPWPWFFSAAEQGEIVDAVRGDAGLCVVGAPSVLDFWAALAGDFDDVRDRPLAQFMNRRFSRLRDYDGVYIDVRR
jgi:hypothetical protein